MSLEGGRDSLSIDTWRQRIHKERRAPGVSAIWEGREQTPSREEGVPPMPKSTQIRGASNVTIYSSIMAGSPRGGFNLSARVSTAQMISPREAAIAKAPRAARPHMQHHFGYGWGEETPKQVK